MLTIVSWSGLGDGTSWSDTHNWSTGALPGASDDVALNLTGNPTVVYSSSAGSTSIHSINGSDALSITGGSLTVTGNSTLGGALSMTGGSLTAFGTGVTFSAIGLTTVSGASLFAAAGATLNLPAATSYSGIVGGTSTLQASGAGSLLSLPNLTTIAEDTTSFWSLTQVWALSGGTVSLPTLTQISVGPVVLESDGAGSLLDIRALTSFQGQSGRANASEFRDLGGNFHTNLSSTDRVNLTLDGEGNINYSQLTSFTNATAILNQVHVLYGGLTDIDGDSFQISGGATLSMPAVSGYSISPETQTTFQASGAGSILSLPGLVTLGVNTGQLLDVESTGGGQIQLPAVTSITSGDVRLHADGAGSVIDLSSLVQYDAYVASNLLAINGGTILVPPLPDLEAAGVTGPMQGSAGQNVLLTWTDENLGAATAAGPWIDTVYIVSPDLAQNYGTLGNFAVNGTLAPGATFQQSEVVTLPSNPGNYRFEVVVNSTFSAGEGLSNGKNNVTPALGTIQIAPQPAPDLVVTSITPPTNPLSGTNVPITFVVENQGTASTSAAVWKDYVILSQDPTVGSMYNGDNDQLLLNQPILVSFNNPSYLAMGQSYSQTVNVPLPLSAQGTWYAYVVTDGTGFHHPHAMPELSYANNLLVSSGFNVTLSTPPDLAVTSVQAPSQAFSGQTMNLTWLVTNNGAGPVPASEGIWNDQVFLSASPSLDSSALSLGTFQHNGALASGIGYANTESVTLPTGISGSYYLIVKTDTGGKVFENGATGNDIGTSAAMTVNLTPPPDLVSTLTVVPEEAQASQSLTFTYRVENSGAGSAPNSSWIDSFYISPSPTFDPNTAIRLGQLMHQGVLAAGDSYTSTASETLPDGLSGTYYLLADADAGNAVFELDKSNNISAPATIQIFSHPADLVVSTASAPATAQAGSGALVNWSVTNQGTGGTAVATWQDNIYADANSALDSSAILVGSFKHVGVLNQGSSYTASQVVTLPIALSGHYNLFVVTNSPAQGQISLPVHEVNEANDTSAPMPVTIVQQLADLAVTSIAAPAAAVSGGTVNVSWTVTNGGPVATNSNYWYDDLWLSKNSALANGGTDVYLGSVQHNNPLPAGATYNASDTVTLPPGMTAGSYYFIVAADRPVAPPSDANNQGVNLVYESSEGNNVTAANATTSIELRAAPDLVASGVSAPSAAIAGQLLGVSWTVTNVGADTNGATITDSVYMSYNQVLGANSDRYLGSFTRNGGLASGAGYTQSEDIQVPSGLAGTFYVFVVTNSNGNLHEASTSNNSAYDAQPVEIDLEPPADLVAGTVTVPVNAVAGQTITITYQVTNNSASPANGTWYDSLYLSPTPTWSIADPLLGQVKQAQNLAPGGTYTGTLSASLPGVAPGAYYIILRTNILNNLPELTQSNNLSASLTETSIDAPPLILGTTTDFALAQAQSAYYKVTAAAGETLQFQLQSDAANASTASNELYVSFGSMPTRAQYGYRYQQPLAAGQTITVPTTQAGTYYVLAYADRLPGSSEELSLSAVIIPFSILQAVPPTMGNAGSGTVEIDGALFDRATTFQLVGPGGITVPATTIDVENASSAYATFDLKGLPTGGYSIRGTAANGATTELASGLLVEAGQPGQVATHLNGPSLILVGRAGQLNINYANTGDNDLGAPLIYVISPSNSALGMDSSYIVQNHNLAFLATSQDGLPGVLRPGEHESRSVFFQAPTTAGAPDDFQTITVQSNNTQPVQWSQVQTWILADRTSAPNWPRAYALLQQWIGPTWGSFVRLLDQDSALVVPSDQNPSQPDEILDVAVEQAIAVVNTSLSGTLYAADLGVPIAGQTVIAVNTATNQSYTTKSFNDGSFVFATIPAGTYALSVDGAIVNSNDVMTVIDGQALTGATLDIATGARIDGRVVDQATGNPIGGASVFAISRSDGVVVESTTTSNGTYSISGLEFADYDLRVEATGHARVVESGIALTTSAAVQNITMGPEATIGGSIHLGSGGPAEGMVRITAEPIGNTDPNQTYAAQTPSSVFALNGLPSGTYDLTIMLDGYLTQTLTNQVASAGQALNLGAINLMPEAVISGTITSGDPNHAAANELIEVMSNGSQIATGESDAAGNFRIDGLTAGIYTLDVPGASVFSANPTVNVGTGQTVNGVTISLQPGGEISGTVVNASTSQPISGVPVFATDSKGSLTQTITDNSGSYLFVGLAPDTYRVFLQIGGLGASKSVSITKTDGTAVTADLQIAYSAELSGQLLDAAGNPITGGAVTLYLPGQPITTAQADDAGNYRFLIVQPGTFDLVATSPSAVFNPVTGVVVGAGAAVVQNIREGNSSLTVSVIDLAQDVAGASVSLVLLNDADGPIQVGGGVAAEDGTVTFTNLVAGSYQVAASLPNGDAGEATVALNAGSAATLSISLTQTASVSGSITDALGNPIGGAAVILQSVANPSESFSTETAANGTYSLTGFAAATYDITAFAQGFQAKSVAAVAVVVGTTANISLSASTTTIDGRLVDASGDPVPIADVSVKDASGHTLGSVVSGSDGSFKLTTVEGSNLTLIVFAQGYLVPSAIQFNANAGADVHLGSLTLQPIAIDPSAKTPGLAAAPFDVGPSWISQLKQQFDDASATIQTQLQQLLTGVPIPSCPDCEAAYDDAVSASADASSAGADVIGQGVVVVGRALAVVGVAEIDGLKVAANVTKALALAAALDAAIDGVAIFLPEVGGAYLIYQIFTDRTEIKEKLGLLSQDIAEMQNAGSEDDFKLDIVLFEQFASEVTHVCLDLSKLISEIVLPSGPLKTTVKGLLDLASNAGEGLGNALEQITNGAFAGTQQALAKLDDDLQKFSQLNDNYQNDSAGFVDALANLEACEDANCNQPPDGDQPPDGSEDPPPDSNGDDPPAEAEPWPPFDAPPGEPGDPNQIVGPGSFGDQNFVSAKASLPYEVLFENDPTATAPAQQIVITEQLDPDLDWRSFRVGSFGWNGMNFQVPANSAFYQTQLDFLQTKGYVVDVTATIDAQTGTATWVFTTIDPATGQIPLDPTIGFLPPDDASGIGEGFVSYTIQAKQTDPTGTVIDAQATVTFFTQPPLNTAQISNALDTGAGLQSSVAPLPATVSLPYFQVSWSGQDGATGSGIASFTIYVSANGSPYTAWLTNTTLTSATYAGQLGHTYAFYSQAIDNVGNVEAASTTAQASISVTTPSTIVGRNLFYAGSSRFDQPGGTNRRPPNTFSDDNAIATDKSAYLAGSGVATFANVSSYDKGINGIMVDVLGGGSHTLITQANILNDFTFKVGNNNAPSTWAAAPNPTTVTVRAGAGVSGSDRVELIWPSGSIKEKWLEVTVLSTADTGLAANDVFFFGSAVANSGGGDTATLSETNSVDELGARNNGATLLNNIPITNIFDYNRDGLVNSVDSLLARNNGQTLGATKHINIPLGGPFAPLPPSGDSAVTSDAAPAASISNGAVASALVSSASPSQSLPTVPIWIVNRLSQVDLNNGPVAKYLQHLAEEDTPKAKAILVKADQGADALNLDDELLDWLLVELGLEQVLSDV